MLEARFGPDPYVWALYLLLNGALLVITFWATLFGLVQWWSCFTRGAEQYANLR